MRPKPKKQDRGFALVTVLWAMVIVSAAVAGVTAVTRGDARRNQRQRERAELTAAADALVSLVILQLVNVNPNSRLAVDGTPFAGSFAGRPARVSIQDEAGRIDLNRAPGDILSRLLRAHGMQDEPAQALTDKVLDWREASIGKRLNGAKADDYHDAGLRYGPRDGPFASVEELKLVMGLPPGLFDRIRPALTVHSQSSSVDPAVAPRAALAALPGMSEERIVATLEARSGRVLQEDSTLVASSILQAQSYTGHAFEITVGISGTEPLRLTRTAAIRLTGQSNAPVWIYYWN